jgi:CRP-like cAMP-binding protein
MPAGAFQEFLAKEPKVAQALLPQLVTKIRALTTRVYEFSTLAVKIVYKPSSCGWRT